MTGEIFQRNKHKLIYNIKGISNKINTNVSPTTLPKPINPFSFWFNHNSTIKMKLLYSIIAFCSLISYTPFSQTISSNAPLCGNANLTLELTATGGTTCSWKGPNSFTSTQQKPNIKSVSQRNRGVYLKSKSISLISFKWVTLRFLTNNKWIL